MTEREEKLVKKIQENQLGINDTFKFNCTQCGKCCINREDILMNARDLFRAAKELGMSIPDFVEAYCEVYTGENTKMPMIRLMPRGSIKRCPLLKDRKCSIHNAKPSVCAIFPLGRGFMQEAKGKNPTPMEAKDMIYFFTDPGCGDGSVMHTVQEWMDSFGIPVYDEFFTKWQKMIFTIFPMAARAEKVSSYAVYFVIYNVMVDKIYLDYNLDEDFEPQFDANIKALIDFISKMPGVVKKKGK